VLPYLGRVSRRLQWLVLGIALVAGIGIGVAVAVVHSSGAPAEPQVAAASIPNPHLDPGAPLSAVAPDFTLTDQFGKRVSLRSLRGKVVVVSFNDPECTTICPLTTTALLRAKELLGPAAGRVELIGIGANPEATQVKWVRAYSQAHGMMRKWRFLTGSLPQMKKVWTSYGIASEVIKGTIDHTPATYVIDTRGRESRLFLTEMAYSSVDQLGYELAQSIAAVLPEHPQLHGSQSLSAIRVLGPRTQVTLPRAGGGSVKLGPGSGPHLVLFFDTWASELTNLDADLDALNRYQAASARDGLPPLVAVDEGGVEPSPGALPRFLRSLPKPLSFPVAVDDSGRVADGYRVQDSPWLTLVSGSSRFLFYYDVSVKGWPTLPQMLAKVHAALARTKS
jgi:cytochrome oxidase Cu insertion factor (SCO1/SenC/PrrC family)